MENELVQCHLSRILVKISQAHVLINLAVQLQCSLCSHFTIYTLHIVLCFFGLPTIKRRHMKSAYQFKSYIYWKLMFVWWMLTTFYSHWTVTDVRQRKCNFICIFLDYSRFYACLVCCQRSDYNRKR